MKNYRVWRTHQPDSPLQHVTYSGWLPTKHFIQARSQRKAEYKLRRRFANAGFHHMSLMAVPTGLNPNEENLK